MPKIDTFWKYCGPRPGCGEIHKVIIADADEDEIITVSPHHSWIGSTADFAKHFRQP